MNLFYILKGNNGATYILNSKSWNSINDSLKFYKALTFKSKILKNGLLCFLFLKGVFGAAKMKSPIEINEYLQSISKLACDFNVDENCSVLISPTKDKVIVHRHNQYFQKFAFGKSYAKVKNETTIYDLFNDDIKNFQVSKFFDSYNDSANFCSFKLSNNHLKHHKLKSNTANLIPSLVEFFRLANGKQCSVEIYINGLLTKIEVLDKKQMRVQIQVLDELKNMYGKLEFPLGLVHRDFKPWNILNFEKPLIFDFEEAVIDGPPLEDLLNFYIDPIIMYKDTKEVYKYIYEKKQVKSYKNYLEKLNIKIDFQIFLNIYIINRIVFWKNENKVKTSKKYVELLKYLEKKNNLK